ncbi:MAG: hemolysin [Candidatus Muiribacterium halophilum]|uniref:Hemolysin n=1 Tax=Muiribacterium halophilum TaxID=2053465 RepID=A0A2N5ZMV5_MUIH1|nr:MAG: hemolysin [Candidatus Muirbacterium halophilum]
MDDPEYLSLIFVFILLVLSAYFSGSETAFFSINKFQFNRMKEGRKKDSAVFKVLERPRRLLVTIVLGNLFVNILSTVAVTSALVKRFGPVKGNTLASGLMMFLLLLFGEISPKIIAINTVESFTRLSAPIMKFFIFLFTPISTILLFIVNTILKIFGLTEYSTSKNISVEDLKSIIDMGSEEGIIHIDETKMLQSVFRFSDTDVQEIMTPRIDMVCLDINMSIEGLKHIILENRYSRMPVYDENIDNIIGILCVKDIASILNNLQDKQELINKLRKPYFVPENKEAYPMLKFMQKHHTHIAIVVDEYGGVEGLLTMEDIIEELVGEIHDESDEVELPYEFIDQNTIKAEAKMNITEVNDVLDLEIEENPHFNTIAGFIMHRLGKIPEVGEFVDTSDLNVKVLSMDGNRIEKVLIHRKENA